MVRTSKLATFLAASLAVALLLVAAAQPGFAQAPPGPLPPKPGAPIQQPPPQPKQARPGGQAPQIRVRVSLVNTPVTVRDAKGEMVLDLAASDFSVFDNGVEQRIDHFDLGGDPLSLVLAFETSSRVEALLPAVRKSGILFGQAVLGQTGEAAVIGFHDSIETLLPFTKDAESIEKSIEKLRLGTSGARLYDALSLAVGMLRNRPADRRRVILVVSEAVDTGSEDKLGAVLREAQLANITIYTVGLSTTAAALRNPPKQTLPPSATPPGTFGLPPTPGIPQTPTTEAQRHGNIDILGLAIWLIQRAQNGLQETSLEVAAIATGGMNISTFRDRSIEQAIDAIGGELHAQYSLTYTPQGTNPTGYHEIKVQVSRAGLNVRARPGYYLAPPEEAEASKKP